MHDEQKTHDTYTPAPVDGESAEETIGVKVYERPARRAIPMWLWLGLVAVLLVLAWFAFQAIR